MEEERGLGEIGEYVKGGNHVRNHAGTICHAAGDFINLNATRHRRTDTHRSEIKMKLWIKVGARAGAVRGRLRNAR